jgi:hypothetical protein
VEVRVIIPPCIFFDQYGSNLDQILDFGRVQVDDITATEGAPLLAGGGDPRLPFLLKGSALSA